MAKKQDHKYLYITKNGSYIYPSVPSSGGASISETLRRSEAAREARAASEARRQDDRRYGDQRAAESAATGTAYRRWQNEQKAKKLEEERRLIAEKQEQERRARERQRHDAQVTGARSSIPESARQQALSSASRQRQAQLDWKAEQRRINEAVRAGKVANIGGSIPDSVKNQAASSIARQKQQQQVKRFIDGMDEHTKPLGSNSVPDSAARVTDAERVKAMNSGNGSAGANQIGYLRAYTSGDRQGMARASERLIKEMGAKAALSYISRIRFAGKDKAREALNDYESAKKKK